MQTVSQESYFNRGFYLISKILPCSPHTPLDRDNRAIKQQPHVHQAEAPSANDVGVAEVLGCLHKLLQRELPRNLTLRLRLRRQRAPAPLAPLH